MGVDVDPEFIIGKDFEDAAQVEEWLQERFPEKYAKYLLAYDGDLTWFMKTELGMACQDITAYNDCGYVVGYDVYDAVGDESGEALKELWTTARETFGNDAKRHMWARYW